MKYSKTLLIACLLGFAIDVYAQTGEEETRYYDVEIIIFKNIQVPRSREFVLPAGLPPRDEVMMDLSSPDSIRAMSELSYLLLKPEELRLTAEAEKIIDSSYYELLLHTGWRQPGVDREQAIPVWVRAGKIFGEEFTSIDSQLSTVAVDPTSTGGRPPAPTPNLLYELEGKITIVLSRYLHTFADLVLRRPRLTIEETPENPLLAERLALSPEARILDNYHLREQRRMRSRSLHYLDHPEFSMLVVITPYEKPDSGDPLTAPPAGN